MNTHVGRNTGRSEWYSPPEYVDAARCVLGGTIDLDPASCEIANRTVKAATFYTAKQNGLAYPWAGTVWMNPPYLMPLISKFCGKLAYHIADGTVTAAVVLVNNATETAWFATLASRAAAICLPRGRVKFLDSDGNPGSPLQGQAILYLGPDTAHFAADFRTFGPVALLTPMQTPGNGQMSLFDEQEVA